MDGDTSLYASRTHINTHVEYQSGNSFAQTDTQTEGQHVLIFGVAYGTNSTYDTMPI